MSDFPFTVGMRVRMTQKALDHHIHPRSTILTGTVVGFSGGSFNLKAIRVRRDGRRGSDAYFPEYWEPIPSGE